jgi:hypothetical protein
MMGVKGFGRKKSWPISWFYSRNHLAKQENNETIRIASSLAKI